MTTTAFDEYKRHRGIAVFQNDIHATDGDNSGGTIAFRVPIRLE
jgi:hypothetical protein